MKNEDNKWIVELGGGWKAKTFAFDHVDDAMDFARLAASAVKIKYEYDHTGNKKIWYKNGVYPATITVLEGSSILKNKEWALQIIEDSKPDSEEDEAKEAA